MRHRISKEERRTVYDKCKGHCAYCGCKLQYKDMQVDHIVSVYGNEYCKTKDGTQQNAMPDDNINSIENFMPSCRQCNFYKSAFDLETFRARLTGGMMENLRKEFNYRLALKYGLIEEKIKPIKFYYERMDEEMANCGSCEYHKILDNGEWGCDNMEAENYGCETDYSDYCVDYEPK